MPTRLNAITPAASDVIVVGDPRRSFLLAQELTESPKMSHLARGLWGYTGGAPSGRPVTIQSTGIGGPSAAAVISDLAAEGVRRIVRLGTCVARVDDLKPGSVVLVESVLGMDGVSNRMGASGEILPDAGLTDLLDGLGRSGMISSHDLLARNDRMGPTSDEGVGPDRPVLARDLQTAATFAVAADLSIAAAALLIVSEDRKGERLEEAGFEPEFLDLGRLVLDRIAPAERLFN